jgi:peptidoglycan/LPS O-acetylase OafA/YrhL
MTTTPRQTHWEVLAALRFFLAWVVLCGHMTWFRESSIPWASAFDLFSGKAAVIGFLLVSGYSIAASLERGETGFYRRRFLRIYPLYFVALLFTLLVQQLLGGHVELPHKVLDSSGPVTTLGNFLLTQTFLVKPLEFDGPIWSLSIEAFYYLLAPLLKRLSANALIGLVLFSMVCFILPKRTDLGTIYFVLAKWNALGYAWSWILGFVLRENRTPATYGCIVLGGALMLWSEATPEPLAIATYVISVALTLLADRVGFPQRLKGTANYLGDISYPLYLVHLPTFLLLYGVLGLRLPWLVVACAFAWTAILYYVVDLQLKPRYIKPLLLGPSTKRVAASRSATSA